MGYIPSDAKWYIAEIIEEITVEGDSVNVVHVNLVLIRADSPEDAYEKAIALGNQGEDTYENPTGKTVCIRFRGLRGLNVIHDELQDGAELLYEERFGVPSDEIKKEIPPKEHLAVFSPKGSRKSPDYSCKEIVDEAKRLLGNSTE